MNDPEEEPNMHRNGSATPTVEGSRSAEARGWTNRDDHARTHEDEIQAGGSSGGGICSSSLPPKIKNTKTLSEIYGHVVEFCKDRDWSEFIQKQVVTATEEEINKILFEIMPRARSLMTDMYGKCVMQELFERVTASQRKELVSKLTGHVLSLSLHINGTRMIEKALEWVDEEQKIQIAAELDGSVMQCVCDRFGNYVIQQCLKCLPNNQIQFIISSLEGSVAKVSMHRYGNRVIQRVIECCDDPRTRQVIMLEIIKSADYLSLDKFGHFVILKVIECGYTCERSAIISTVSHPWQIVMMSQDEYASEIIQKCLTLSMPVEQNRLIQQIIGYTYGNVLWMEYLAGHPLGNHVVTTMLNICDDQTRQHILSRIRAHFHRCRHDRDLVYRLKKLIPRSPFFGMWR